MTFDTDRTAASTPEPVTTPDFTAIKARQQQTWASGDFAIIGTTLQIVGETVCEAADVRTDERVLDVACGNGNAALAAARRFAKVTGLDYVPALLAGAQRRAAAEGLTVELREGDAESLPFPDRSFDVVLSTFGVMFAPDHERAARELARVCRPGGRIGLACWTPEGFIGQLFKVVGKHVPPPAGLRSPALWGSESHVRSLFPRSTSFTLVRRNFAFRYASADHFIDMFRSFYGPTHKAFLALDEAGRASLHAEMKALLAKHNVAGSGSLVVPGEYLESVIVA